MDDLVISVKDLYKDYTYYKTNHQKIQGEIFGRDTGVPQPALKGISFDVKRGEKIALIGRRGSGRSTLLRILSGVIQPDSGTVTVNGNVSSIVNLRMTFDAALTGRDNLRMRASLMGWSKDFLHEHEQEIIEFADLQDIIDQPVSTYQVGSATRLGFAMETTVKPEILLYDEWFAVGLEYVTRCIERLKQLIDGDDSTMIMVFSNIAVSRKLCTRGIVLQNGDIVFDGKYKDAIKYYRANCKVDAGDNDEDENSNSDSNDSQDVDDSSDSDFGDF